MKQPLPRETIEHARSVLRLAILDTFRRGEADHVVRAIETLIEVKISSAVEAWLIPDE